MTVKSSRRVCLKLYCPLTGDLPELLAAVEVLLGGAVAQRLDDLEGVLLVIARPPVRHTALTLYLQGHSVRMFSVRGL